MHTHTHTHLHCMILQQFEILKKCDADGHINALRDHYITIDRANQLFFERGIPGYTSFLNDKFVCDAVTKNKHDTDNFKALVFFEKIDDTAAMDEAFGNLEKENDELREIIKKLEAKKV